MFLKWKKFPSSKGPESKCPSSRAQASVCPDSKRAVTQSPRVQGSSRLESKLPVAQSSSVQSSEIRGLRAQESIVQALRPDYTSRVQLFRYAFLNLNAIYCNGFCSNVL